MNENINELLCKACESLYGDKSGGIEGVKKYVEMGADVNYIGKNKYGTEYSPLYIAVENDSYEIVNYLLEKGANSSILINNTSLLDSLISDLCDLYTDFDYQEIEYQDEKNFKSLFELLLQYDADINRRTGRTRVTILDDFLRFKQEMNNLGYKNTGKNIEKYLRDLGAKTTKELEAESTNE